MSKTIDLNCEITIRVTYDKGEEELGNIHSPATLSPVDIEKVEIVYEPWQLASRLLVIQKTTDSIDKATSDDLLLKEYIENLIEKKETK